MLKHLSFYEEKKFEEFRFIFFLYRGNLILFADIFFRFLCQLGTQFKNPLKAREHNLDSNFSRKKNILLYLDSDFKQNLVFFMSLKREIYLQCVILPLKPDGIPDESQFFLILKMRLLPEISRI